MAIVIESRRKKRATIEKVWPGALILDVTSKGEEPWVRFSPFYPHGGIPIPNSPGTFAQSVEGRVELERKCPIHRIRPR